jgi:hypothetical protein
MWERTYVTREEALKALPLAWKINLKGVKMTEEEKEKERIRILLEDLFKQGSQDRDETLEVLLRDIPVKDLLLEVVKQIRELKDLRASDSERISRLGSHLAETMNRVEIQESKGFFGKKRDKKVSWEGGWGSA